MKNKMLTPLTKQCIYCADFVRIGTDFGFLIDKNMDLPLESGFDSSSGKSLTLQQPEFKYAGKSFLLPSSIGTVISAVTDGTQVYILGTQQLVKLNISSGKIKPLFQPINSGEFSSCVVNDLYLALSQDIPESKAMSMEATKTFKNPFQDSDSDSDDDPSPSVFIFQLSNPKAPLILNDFHYGTINYMGFHPENPNIFFSADIQGVFHFFNFKSQTPSEPFATLSSESIPIDSYFSLSLPIQIVLSSDAAISYFDLQAESRPLRISPEQLTSRLGKAMQSPPSTLFRPLSISEIQGAPILIIQDPQFDLLCFKISLTINDLQLSFLGTLGGADTWAEKIHIDTFGVHLVTQSGLFCSWKHFDMTQHSSKELKGQKPMFLKSLVP